MKTISIISGDKHGSLTAIKKDVSKSYPYWTFRCDCGRKKSISKYDVLSGRTKSCGCSSRITASSTWLGRIVPTIVGTKTGLLTVSGFDHKRNNKSYWKCKCECGNEIIVSLCNIRSKTIRSCGCLRTHKYKPGEAGLKKVYSVYKRSAKKEGRKFELGLEEFKNITSSRCYYCGTEPNQISVSTRTKKKEVVDYTRYLYNGIDRIDSNKGYEKGNVVPCCRWCNIAKSDRTVKEFKDHISKMCHHMGLI